MVTSPLPELTFTYGTVEKALAVAYSIPETARSKGFRAMVANLRKLGALGAQARVGRGAALDYTPTEFHRLILALEFCELGIPPATAVSLLDTYWEPKLKPIVDAAARPIGALPEAPDGADVILYLGGVGLRTGSLRGETGPSVPNISESSLDTLPLAAPRWLTAAPDTPTPPRGLVVNLSARLRVFHAALGVENLTDALDERRQARAKAAKRTATAARKAAE